MRHFFYRRSPIGGAANGNPLKCTPPSTLSPPSTAPMLSCTVLQLPVHPPTARNKGSTNIIDVTPFLLVLVLHQQSELK